MTDTYGNQVHTILIIIILGNIVIQIGIHICLFSVENSQQNLNFLFSQKFKNGEI